MPFTPSHEPSLIPGMGKQNADIMIIGDCPTVPGIKEHKPITAPIEGVLESCLHQAGLIKSQVYITNFIPDDTRLGKYWKEPAGSAKGRPLGDQDEYKQLMMQEIDRVKPKVIVTLGPLPAWHLTGDGETTKTRGYPFKHEDVIVIPTLHPGKMIWGNYIWRYYLAHDLSKAKELAENPNLLYAPFIKVCIPESFEEAKAQLDSIATYDTLSIDIEVANFEVSCIGFAVRNNIAFSIPLDMRWTIEEEVTLWNLIAGIMGDEKIDKIGQNFIFDIHFLAYKMGIITRGKIIDTMMSHSIMYPDFLKALNFLGSVYTKQPYWKNMVKFKDIKKES